MKMETVTLIKDHQKRQFSPRAAKIAVEHLGWSELPAKPDEVGTKTKPPLLGAPKKLKDIPIEKKVSDDLAEARNVEESYPGSNDDLGNAKPEDLNAIPAENQAPAASDAEKVEEPVKKTRKTPVRSKSK